MKDLFRHPADASIEGQELTGPQVVRVEGVSCRVAFRHLREWVESGQTDDGFEVVADRDGDPDSIEFVNDEDTRTPEDDQTITVQDPLGCFLGISCGPSGSTVAVITQNATPMTVTVTKGSGAGGTLAPGGRAKTATGYASGDPYDVGVKVTDGSANQVKIQAYSSAFDHKVEIYLNGPDGLWLVPKCTWLTLNVDETATCTDARGKFTVKRIADDPNYSPTRYRYQFTVNFSAYPSGSTINLTNDGSDPHYVTVTKGSGTSEPVPPQGTLTSSGYIKGGNFDVFLCFYPGQEPDSFLCRALDRRFEGFIVAAASGEATTPGVSIAGSDVAETFNNMALGESRLIKTVNWRATVTRVANDLTPSPEASSNRYQYNVAVTWIS